MEEKNSRKTGNKIIPQRHASGEHTAVVTTRDLGKSFGNFVAVRNLSLDIFPGEIFGFLGPNGAGKTTSIRMILGLLQPSTGSASVLGIDVQKKPEAIRPRVGYMAQRFSLYNDLTVIQNLQFYGAAYGLEKNKLAERINAALDMAGLRGRERSKTAELAGGWRQRLALGAAILHQPEIIFLDEPTAGVDPVSRREFWDLLYKLAAGGVTVFVTTHYMDEAEHCHRLAFIQRGEVIAQGSPGQIKQQAVQGQVLEVVSDQAGEVLKVMQQLRTAEQLPLEMDLYGASVRIVTPDKNNYQKLIRKALKKAGVGFDMVEPVEPTLEDVFIASMR
ncbi:MAG: ABC transporter ATP-binding protein [Anaerolineales bacterium]|nr:ABC transporter ATP-binding protein [Anaerolineales bacterium]